MRPTLRQLEYFVAVADHGHFTKAARACRVSQPGLSAQLAELEALLEVRLFERGRGGARPTPAGQAALDAARRTLAEADRVVQASRAGKRPLVGPLALGAIPTIAPYFLPRALAKVRRDWPELKLRLFEGPTEACVERLLGSRLDVALLALPIPEPELASEPLFDEPFLCALPAGHRLAGRKTLRESDLEGEAALLLEDGH